MKMHSKLKQLGLFALIIIGIGACAARKKGADQQPAPASPQPQVTDTPQTPPVDQPTTPAQPATPAAPVETGPRITQINGSFADFAVVVEGLPKEHASFYLRYHKNHLLQFEGNVDARFVYERGTDTHEIRLGAISALSGRCPAQGEPVCITLMLKNPPAGGPNSISMARSAEGILRPCATN